MVTPPIVLASNYLIASLPLKEREQLLAHCDAIELNFSKLLYQAGDCMAHVYFPLDGFISLVTAIDDNAKLEVGMVGNEGMLGITTLLDVDIAPFNALIQGGGSALRISTLTFRRILEHSPALQRVLKRYLYVCMKQLAQTAACTRFHLVEERLARWLLMTRDRAHSDHFHVTHVFLAYMLGVRRVGITKAAKMLQQKKLISYQRGDITVLDSIALEAIACRCYRVDKNIYASIMAEPAD
jgi:CRP-like cAMP-binding protein